jgi:hypothetical protein
MGLAGWYQLAWTESALRLRVLRDVGPGPASRYIRTDGTDQGGSMPKRKSPLAHGFHSRQQWKFFFSSKNPKLRKLARKEAHKTQRSGGGKVVAYRKLPRRKGARRRG